MCCSGEDVEGVGMGFINIGGSSAWQQCGDDCWAQDEDELVGRQRSGARPFKTDQEAKAGDREPCKWFNRAT